MNRFKAALGIFSVVAVAGFSAPAFAQDMGFYIGATFGSATQDGQCEGVVAGISCDDKDSAWRILGGYQLNRNLAVELGYHNLGEASASGGGLTVTDEVTAWELLAVGSFPLANQFSIYGKAGIYRGEVERTVTLGGLSASADESGTEFTFGLGARYDFMPNLGVRAEWQRYMDLLPDVDVDVLSIGLIFRFR
jgi:OOP family OmpA-OmpF porin